MKEISLLIWKGPEDTPEQPKIQNSTFEWLLFSYRDDNRLRVLFLNDSKISSCICKSWQHSLHQAQHSDHNKDKLATSYFLQAASREHHSYLLFLQSHRTDNQHTIQPHTESRSLCYNLDTLISSQFHHFHSQSILNKPYKGNRFYPTLKRKSRTRDQTISQTKLERWW